MSRNKPRSVGAGATAGAGSQPRSYLAAILVASFAVVIALLALHFVASSPPPPPTSSSASPSPQRSPRPPPPPLALVGGGTLQGFSEQHNTSLLWGTYRPGVYLGLRSHTWPVALVAGLMWVADGAPAAKLRHQCEQDAVERYGYSVHDGRGFGVQPIVDGDNAVKLQTSFVATDGGGWALRVEAPAGAVGRRGRKARKQSVFLYVAVDAELADDADDAGDMARAPPLPSQSTGGRRVTGRVRGLGAFTLVADAHESGGEGGGEGGGGEGTARAVRMDAWGSADPGDTPLTVEGRVRAHLEAQQQGQQGQQGHGGARAAAAAGGALPDEFDARSRLVVLQARVAPPFVIDVALLPRPCDADADACASAHRAVSGASLTALIGERQAAFRERLDRELLGDHGGRRQPLTLRGAPLTDAAHDFAASALAAQLGSLGFFYGSSLVAAPSSVAHGAPRPLQRTPAAPLLAVVPSRPFFPRGFLWDEVSAGAGGVCALARSAFGHFHAGHPTLALLASSPGLPPLPPPMHARTRRDAHPFVPTRACRPRGAQGFHQLVVGAWDPALADHILASWLGLMHADGWIPREQILGAEAVARVPDEFVAQHREHANPPALLLRLERLLERADAADAAAAGGGGAAAGAAAAPLTGEEAASLQRLGALWPRLVRWHAWFVRTQAGELPHSYRWRGRNPNDRRLNALTLSSGLDDYPRATKPTASERHVDLHCWVALFTRLLARLGTRLGHAHEASAYAHQLDELLAALVDHHWDAPSGAFTDFGMHANDGSFAQLYVVKCASADGSDSIEHDVSDPNRPRCPRSHPRFLFPLGDGHGGLLTRPTFVRRPPTENQRGASSAARPALSLPPSLPLSRPERHRAPLVCVCAGPPGREGAAGQAPGLRLSLPSDAPPAAARRATAAPPPRAAARPTDPLVGARRAVALARRLVARQAERPR